ncbi:hypothetical protein COLO4_24799 [Corchorus olitorius]|uniref:Uncharacterized protein n=1 Tax=Corchorus olitorius TaxID=93759 RepID=A0A1R3I6S9_9ROSI|nr:hypothetical protein COLO4_24799 [Corchorus olitorius]
MKVLFEEDAELAGVDPLQVFFYFVSAVSLRATLV